MPVAAGRLGWFAFLSVAALLAGSTAAAQSSLAGRVLSDSGRVPVPQAELRIPRLGIVASADEAGRYSLRELRVGAHLVVVRAVGFAPESVLVEVEANESISRDFVLKRVVQPLGEVRVTDSIKSPSRGRYSAFDERRQRGSGRFLDRAIISKWESRRTGDLLSTVSGVNVRRRGSNAFVTGFRAAARNAGVCYMDVFLDGILVYTRGRPGGAPMPPFDVNTIGLSTIEAIEVYASQATVPAELDRTLRRSEGCGAIAIWTR